MDKGPFPAKQRNWGDTPSDWALAPSTAWFCPKCGYLKARRCTYRGHRSFLAGDLEGRRRYERTVKALQRKAKERLCASPECESPFLPLHARQRHCSDRCRDRAKYLRRRA
jgi:hypothetical protein